jgi:hypothetical protein
MDSITTDAQLARLAHRIGLTLTGIYGVEDLTHVPFVPGKYLLNLGNAHWVALRGLSYFDSFGYIYPMAVQRWAHPTSYNETQVQAYRSGFCGQYCLLWLLRGPTVLENFEPLNRVRY